MKQLAIDIGQVICHLDFNQFNKKLSAYAGISEEESNNFLLDSQKSHDLGFSILERDLENKFYKFKLPLNNVKDLIEEWHKTVSPNKTVMDWLVKMLNSNVEIALVSNIGIEHANTMKDMLYPIYDRTIKFFSYEVGARKPTYVYYQTFLNMYPQFKGCVYVDDNSDNIITGKLFGLESCLFDLSKIDEDEISNKLYEIENKVFKQQKGMA